MNRKDASGRLFEIADAATADALIFRNAARSLMMGTDAPNRVAKRLFTVADRDCYAKGEVRKLAGTIGTLTRVDHDHKEKAFEKRHKAYEVRDKAAEAERMANPEMALAIMELDIRTLTRAIALIEYGKVTPAFIEAIYSVNTRPLLTAIERFRAKPNPTDDKVVMLFTDTPTNGNAGRRGKS